MHAVAPRPGSGYAYFCVLTGVFITALYTFRMFFMTFHGKERMDHHTQEHLHESPWVVTVPLILLAIPSALIGWFTVEPMLFGDFFDGAIHVLPANDVLEQVGEEFHGSPVEFMLCGIHWRRRSGSPAWACSRPRCSSSRGRRSRMRRKRRFKWLYTILVDKYGFDWFNEHVIMAGRPACWAAACGASAIRSSSTTAWSTAARAPSAGWDP